jgi:26S proteasome regulatory subunit N8
MTANKSNTNNITSNMETSSSVSIRTVAAIDEVVMHPLVLLSAADHYHRVARGTRKRVVGVLLGQVFKGKIDVTNSFGVPFEEDSRNPVR